MIHNLCQCDYFLTSFNMTYSMTPSGGIKTTSDVRASLVELTRMILEEIIPQWETDNKFDLFKLPNTCL